jgi:hypothetical protein
MWETVQCWAGIKISFKTGLGSNLVLSWKTYGFQLLKELVA